MAKPSVVSKILSLIGSHGHVVAALLAEMQDVEGTACFENCETEFRYSEWEAPVLLWRVAKYVLWKTEERWKARGWSLSFGVEPDNEYVLRSMMWADNNWLFCHGREILVHLVNDIIEELLNLDMEPKPETLWWKFVRGGGQAHAPGGRGRERLGIAVHGGLRGIGVSFSA